MGVSVSVASRFRNHGILVLLLTQFKRAANKVFSLNTLIVRQQIVTLGLGRGRLVYVLLLPLQVVLRQVATLALAARVVRAVCVRARGRHPRLAFAVVAVVAHVFGVVPHVLVVADKNLAHLLRILLYRPQALLAVLKVDSLQLECSN